MTTKKTEAAEPIELNTCRIVNGGVTTRCGYRGFLSFVWFLFNENRNNKKFGVEMIYTIKLPIKHWLR